MSRIDKLKQRFLSEPIPTDFRWDDLVRMLDSMGFTMETNDGSARRFVCTVMPEIVIFIHEPHPKKILKNYQMRDIRQILRDNGLL